MLPEGPMYTRYRGAVQGPFRVEELQLLVKRGALTRLFQLSRDQSSWVSAAQYPELFPKVEIRASVPPPVPVPASAAPSPDPTPPEAVGGYDLQPESAPGGAESGGWYYVLNDEEYGPVDFGQLQLLVATRTISPEDYVWTDVLPDWVPAGSLPDLYGPPTAPPVAAPAPAPPLDAGPTQTCGMAVASFVLGLLGATALFVIGSVLAIVFGHVALRQIENSRNTLAGRGMAIAGLILGYVVIGIAAITGFVVFFLVGTFARAH